MPGKGVATQREFESQEFWDDLLAFVEAKNVVPVVGPELPTVVFDGREVPLYRAIAERLLQNYTNGVALTRGGFPWSRKRDSLGSG